MQLLEEQHSVFCTVVGVSSLKDPQTLVSKYHGFAVPAAAGVLPTGSNMEALHQSVFVYSPSSRESNGGLPILIHTHMIQLWLPSHKGFIKPCRWLKITWSVSGTWSHVACVRRQARPDA